MKASLVSIAAAIAVIIGTRVWAQETVAPPSPVAAAATVQPVAEGGCAGGPVALSLVWRPLVVLDA